MEPEQHFMALQGGIVEKPRHYFRVRFRIHYFFVKKKYFEDGWGGDSTLSAVNSMNVNTLFQVVSRDPDGSCFEHHSTWCSTGVWGDKLPSIRVIPHDACRDLERMTNWSSLSDFANAGALHPKQA